MGPDDQSPQSYQQRMQQQRDNMLAALHAAAQAPQIQADTNPLLSQFGSAQGQPGGAGTDPLASMQQQYILGSSGPLTETFGQKQAIEHYSGGITNGIGIGVPEGTPVALPPGQWQVVESFNGATSGGQGDPQMGINRGYGNSVLARNMQTGDMLRLSHLSKNGAQAGQVLPGDTVFGLSGHTGNTTGPHLNLEYYDSQGKLADPLMSPYAPYFNVASGQSTGGKGGGNPFSGLMNYGQQVAQNLYKGYRESPTQYSQNTNAGLAETIGNALGNNPETGIGKFAGEAFHAVSPYVGHMLPAIPAFGALTTGAQDVNMPVKTGLADIYDNRSAVADALKRYDTTMGDMAPVTPQFDGNLYPDLLSHWQTAYGANKRPPQSMADMATEVRDALRGALNWGRQQAKR